MSTPLSPAEDAAVQAGLAAQAQTVTGVPSAGIYGDPAGASQPAQPIDLSKATPVSVDTDALLARLAALESAAQAAAAQKAADEEAAKPAPVVPDYKSLTLSGAHSAELHDLVRKLEERFQVLEGTAEPTS